MSPAGSSRHSVGLVLLVTLMIVATSHWMISNKRSTGITSTAGGEDDVASAASSWCNGSRVNGQCQPTYGGDPVDLNMLQQDDLSVDMVVEYFDSDGSARRVLTPVPKLDLRRVGNPRQPVCLDQEGHRYTCHLMTKGHRIPLCPPKATYNRNCML